MRNFILSTFCALFLNFMAANALVPSGTYYILNNIIPSTGEQLSATFRGQGKNVVVQPLIESKNQRWTITEITPTTQSIVPVTDQSKATTESGGNVVTQNGPGFGWTINQNADGTVSIGDQSNNFWDVGVHYNIVLTSGGQSRQTQSWVLKTAVVDQ